MIFIDADAYIALSVAGDANRSIAVRLAEKITESNESTSTSWDVIDEVATKLSYYFSRNLSDIFLRKVFSADTVIHFQDAVVAQDAVKLFLKQSSKKVSMTDCTNMVIAKHLGITTFFSFDHHYEQNGFTLLK